MERRCVEVKRAVLLAVAAAESKNQMECCAALELVFFRGLVVAPVLFLGSATTLFSRLDSTMVLVA